MREISLVMVGFGNVGQALGHLLLRKRQEMAEKYGLSFQVTGIATRRRGTLVDPWGINLEEALAAVEQGRTLESLSKQPSPASMEEFIIAARGDVLFENTPVSHKDGEPAISTIRTALERGMHAVTANKGPVAHAYRELTALAAQHGSRFYFESAVMDGAPVFSVFREALPGANVTGFTGILNSSTNLLLGWMEDGKAYAEALEYAQSIGILETDPSADVDGWDAAIKVTCLANVLMGGDLKVMDIDREGIGAITAERVAEAKAAGMRWKLVCRAMREGDRIAAQVKPELVTPESPLYSIRGTSSYVQFETDVLPGLGIVESNPGPDTTAYGLLADLLNIYRER